MITLYRYLRFTALLTAFAATCVAEPANQVATNPAEAKPTVVFETSMGIIKLELYPEKAPITVANFIEYANEGFYNETIFHRVIAYFMIQGGGMGKDLRLKPTRDAIKSEADNGLNNDRGTLAMARTQDVNSAKAQFFINVEDNAHLNYNKRTGGYTVFGRVIEGMQVVDAIADVDTNNFGRHFDMPLEPVILHAVKVLNRSDSTPARP